MYDAIVIGAGVVGCAVARELSKYNMRVVVVEKCCDVCEGTSKANSGIVHAGFDAESGSLKAKFIVEGNRMIRELYEILDFPYKQNGSLVVSFDKDNHSELERLKKQGEANGVEGMTIISGDEARKLESSLSKKVEEALFAPTGGVVCPFGMTIAFAENAVENGVEFAFETEVYSIDKGANAYILHTSKGSYTTKTIVNAAGVNSDQIHNMVSSEKVSLNARKGEFILFDKEEGNNIRSTIFQLTTTRGKDILVTSTVHGNLLVGQNVSDEHSKYDVSTTSESLLNLTNKAEMSINGIPMKEVITSFAGVQAYNISGDYIINEIKDAPLVFDAVGIESPGLTSAPAIGKYIAESVAERLGSTKKAKYKIKRKGVFCMSKATRKEKEEKIKENSQYANVICRCEGITEGEIRDAIKRPIGAKTIDGIKRRTRAGMGKCQASFCILKTMEILAEELNVSVDGIIKSQKGSKYLYGETKRRLWKGGY